MKPKLLLISGFGWSATSPLIYTLQRNAKYAHFGYTKVFRYKKNNDITFQSINNESINIYDHICNGTWENYKSHEPATHNMNLTVDLQPLHDFSLSHIKKLMRGERTARKWVDFYHALHDHVVTKGYQSVGRMSTGGEKEFLEILMSEFDVKVLAIARDPVRRAFSEYLCKSKVYSTSHRFNDIDYMDKINRLHKKFGEDKTHIVVMEELWEGDGTSKKELSEFLEHPITNLWKNLYAPDRGHLIEYDKDVPCQAYGQDLLELTPETYYSLKEEYQYIYDSWKDYYGSLPLYWGQPIKYS